jgi:multidrug resistance protein MdtO
MMQMLQHLRADLAPKPGRLENVLRITVLTVLLVILLETFQTPLPAYSAYILFFISKEEAASTILTGLIVTISITISVFLTIAIYMISANEPGLRLPLMAIIIFAGMFVSRASPFGSIGFLIGFLVTISLTLVDVIPANDPLPVADLLTRSVLWLWVVVMLPVALVIIGNIFTGRNPADLFDQGLKERLELAARLLTDPFDNPSDQKPMVEVAESKTSQLFRYLKIPAIFSNKLQKNHRANEGLLAQTGRLMDLLNEWIELKVSEPQLLEVASQCGAMLLSLAQAIKSKTETLPSFQKLTMPTSEGDTIHERKAFLLLATIIGIVETLPILLVSRSKPQSATSQTQKNRFHLLAADAFSNPDYCRYALKTTLAIFIAYITYNMLNWPGIRTCMITCFFVSQGTFGETAQKMTLRIIGALIGGGLGLATIIFLMPYLTTIMDLSLIIAALSFFAAWVATSSERLSYAGLQIALAFFLSILVGYGPTIDLTEARDRVVGVLLGNLIIFLVYTLIWPTSVGAQAKLSLADALYKLSQMMAIEPIALRADQSHKDELFFAFSNAISQTSRLISLSPFESKYMQVEKVTLDSVLQDAVQAISGPVLILVEQSSLIPISAIGNKEMTTYWQLLRAWLAHVAEQLKSDKGPLLPLPKPDTLIRSFEESTAESSDNIWLLACKDWYHTLDERMQNLETLIKKAVLYAKIPLNQAVREST